MHYDFRVKTMFDSSVPPFFCNGFMLYYCYFYLFAHTGVRYHSYITRCPCRLTVTRRLLLVEQDIHEPPFQCTCVHPLFKGCSCCSIPGFLYSVLSTIACLYVHFRFVPLCFLFFDLQFLITPHFIC